LKALFEAIDRGAIEAVASGITLMEVLVAPYRAGNHPLAERYEACLDRQVDRRLIDLEGRSGDTGRGVDRFSSPAQPVLPYPRSALATDSMDIDYYAKYFAFESEDWWFKGRRRIVLGLLSDALSKGPTASDGKPLRIVDAGAGTGITLSHLGKLGSAIGVDSSPEAIRFCWLRGHRDLVRADLADLGLGAARADVVACLDVIEHVFDDDAALRELYRVCKPNGVLALTVPAFPVLWSEHDIINHHRRRYRRSELNALVTNSGFVIELLSFYNFWLSPLAVGLRLVKRLWTVLFPQVVGSITSDNTYLPRSINWLFATVFGSELALLRRGPLPFGVSLVCIARKPGASDPETATKLVGAARNG